MQRGETKNYPTKTQTPSAVNKESIDMHDPLHQPMTGKDTMTDASPAMFVANKSRKFRAALIDPTETDRHVPFDNIDIPPNKKSLSLTKRQVLNKHDDAKNNIHGKQELKVIRRYEDRQMEVEAMKVSTGRNQNKGSDVKCNNREKESEEILLKGAQSTMQQERDTGVDSDEKDILITRRHQTQETVQIKVHRGKVFGELEQYFTEKMVNFDEVRFDIEMLLPNGKIELAEDNGGVMRDALCEFWSEFYEKCTDGERMKVPIISANRKEEHWTSYAKILVLGYKQENYLPVQLAPCFMRSAISGDHTEKHKDMIFNYFLFLNQDDADVVKKAIEDFDPEDNDDILDFLSEHKINKLPSQENIEEIITQLAHKELIQAPAFISNCWSPVLKPHMGKLLAEDIAKRFNELSPTSPKVLKALQFPDKMEVKHEKVKQYLQKYIKTCDDRKLKLLLRFCTGNICSLLVIGCDKIYSCK